MPLTRNTLLNNRYKIMEVLGQGGMGSVYRVIDENLGVEVAVKENLYTTEEYSKQFRLEATILASMRHPNLPRVFDHFSIDDQGQYLVMDYIDGEDLRQRMDRVGILPDEEVVVMGAAICDALEFLHSRNPVILHRDIKPGNIKINDEGGIYLVDFGLAKVVEGSQATTTGARAMTPGYSSPEQYGTARTDPRSDIYSLGATLYAAITANIPEDGLARAMEQIDLTPLRKRNPRVSRKLATTIEKALQIHPDDRFQTASEFKLALLVSSATTKQLVEGGELTIPPPPVEKQQKGRNRKRSKHIRVQDAIIDMSGESIARKKRRRGGWLKRLIRNVGLLIVLLIGILFYYLWTTNSIDDAIAYSNALLFGTPTPTVPISTDVTEEVLVVSTVEETAMLTDLPSVTIEPSLTNVPTRLPSQTPSSTSTLQPTTTVALFLTPTITPIGGGQGQIAFASNRTGIPQIWLVNSDGTGLVRITDIEVGACQPTWSPDGTQIVYISPCAENKNIYFDAELSLMNSDGSGMVKLPTGVGSFDPAWSHDGETILYVKAINTFRTQIYRIGLVDNSIRLMTDNQKLNLNPDWSPDDSRFIFSSTRVGGQALWVQVNDPDVEPLLLTRSGEKLNTFPDWSSDGENILFSQKSEAGGVPLIYMVNYAMLGVPATDYVETRISNGWIVPEDEADRSHDGYWIVFESWPEGDNHDIYIYNPSALILTQLTLDPAVDFDPAWRPIWE